jgi:radical SAM-linked protein
MPKISFEDTLPIGMESLCETLFLSVAEDTDPFLIIEKLNKQLPQGMSVLDCKQDQNIKSKNLITETYLYEVELQTGNFDKYRLELFEKVSEVVIERTNKKGVVKKIDLKKVIKSIDLVSPVKVRLALSYESGIRVRPSEIIKNIFALSEENLKSARIVKISII